MGIGTFEELATFSAISGTAYEMPVVADVDGEGASAIVVTGAISTAISTKGSVRIYKTGNQYPWAPARKVWNQYMYNAVNINEDLTIPRYPINPATIFPNNEQPYNAFLQQQSIYTQNGDQYWPIRPNVAITGRNPICIGETTQLSPTTGGTWTSSNGCSFETNKIEIKDSEKICINIPNAFTPNEDGINDTWVIDGLEYFPKHEVIIFNRWGQELYRAGINDKPWNGKYKGKYLPTTSYIYIIKLNINNITFNGIVTLIR